ncbi:branched-subunit amino acid aminotransferase/4-amino-4-deoxychorismate lyase [Haloactinospora alba]|uniref:Branched-subunit amino acid aminotransferase/4-amino-4-deoxychorismate lyase n=1 Tax=Haloactinospora alba TaxID=405555 RepID=A0A543NLE3_9ACTN|nr:aminotransferase class IV family protein [Haloactinospora alba]TQN32636.1 branched-subunit amino acid aminotransferase/4-amino-4-deoxychorismate lyase [Haloactinospora alba]
MAELNGEPVTPEDLQTLALVNYGHFTSMRVDNQHIRGLSHHMERIAKDSLEVFGTELDRDYVRELVRHSIGNQDGAFVVRITVFDPEIQLGNPGKSSNPNVLITTRPAMALPATPLQVQSATYVRDMPLVKHIGLFGAIRHRRNAQMNGFDDALFVDQSSYISEGATWNIAFFDGENVVWPDSDVLPGVTMRLLQQVHEKTVISPVGLKDLERIQAVFATNTTVGVRPVTAIDGVNFPAEHEIFESLRKEYEEIPTERI